MLFQHVFVTNIQIKVNHYICIVLWEVNNLLWMVDYILIMLSFKMNSVAHAIKQSILSEYKFDNWVTFSIICSVNIYKYISVLFIILVEADMNP